MTPWTAACQDSLSIANSLSLLKLMSIELVMSSNHLILCCPLLLPLSIFPSIKMFSNESVHPIRWPKYWIFSFINSQLYFYTQTANNQESTFVKISLTIISKNFKYLWIYLYKPPTNDKLRNHQKLFVKSVHTLCTDHDNTKRW